MFNSDETQETAPGKERIKSRLQVLKNCIANYSGYQNGILFKQETMKKEEEISNKIFLQLAQTLTNSSEICISKDSDEYLDSANIFCNMLCIVDKIGKGEIKFTRDTSKEQERIQQYKETEVYAFKTTNVPLDNGEIADEVVIFIRPTDLLGDTIGDVKEIRAQARTRLTVKTEREGTASIRIDPPDARYDNNVVIDLQIDDPNKKKRNKVNLLKNIGATSGHHFNSGIKISDFANLTPADIHRAIANRFIQLSILE